jgi:hypothetical protein
MVAGSRKRKTPPSDKIRSVVDLTDEDLRNFGQAAGQGAYRAALKAGVAVPVLEGDKLKFVTTTATKYKVSA